MWCWLSSFFLSKRERKSAEDERRVAATLFCRCPRRGRLSFVARSFVWPAASPHSVSFIEERAPQTTPNFDLSLGKSTRRI